MLSSYKWIWIGALFTVLAGLAIIAKPTYNVIWNWRAEQLIAEATELREQGNLSQALSKAASAQHLRKMNPKVLREVARILNALEDPRSNGYWEALIEHGYATPADYREYATNLLKQRNLVEAERVMRMTTPLDGAEKEDLLLRQQIARIKQNYPRAIKLCRDLLRLDPSDNETTLKLAEALILNAQPADVAEGMKLLDELKFRDDQAGLEANALLCQIPQTDDIERLKAAERLKAHPLSSTPYYLLSLTVYTRLNPQEKEALISRLLSDFRERSLPEKIAAGRWLNRNGAYQDVLTLIDKDIMLEHTDLFLIRMDALALLKRWDEIEDTLIRYPDTPIEPFVKELFMARVKFEQGNQSQAIRRWEKALETGANLDHRLAYAGKYAEKLGYHELAERTYKRMTQNPKTARQGYIGLINTYRQTKSSEQILLLLKEMQEMFPQEQDIRNDVNYYRLLLELNSQQAYDSALELYQNNPKVMAYRITLALGLLKASQPETAEELLDVPGIDWKPLSDPWKAIRAITLIATGNYEKARELLETIDFEKLSEEENELILQWVNR